MNSRRQFLNRSAAGLLGAAMVSRVGAASLPEAASRDSAEAAPPLVPTTGRPYNPVVTLNGWSLPWRMRNGWKEFHLVAEPVRRELAPGMTANLWGYNGMLSSVFELLADSREQVTAVNAYIESLRDFWIAESDLQMALTGRSPGASQLTRTASPAAAQSGGGH